MVSHWVPSLNTVARDVPGGKRILIIKINAQHNALSKAINLLFYLALLKALCWALIFIIRMPSLTCEILFPSVFFCTVSNETCEILFQSVFFFTVSNGTGEVLFKSVFFALSPMGHVKFHFNLPFFHCLQCDM